MHLVLAISFKHETLATGDSYTCPYLYNHFHWLEPLVICQKVGLADLPVLLKTWAAGKDFPQSSRVTIKSTCFVGVSAQR